GFMPASNETRVRVDGFSKSRPSVTPDRSRVGTPRRQRLFSSAASASSRGICCRGTAMTVKRSLPNGKMDVSSDPLAQDLRDGIQEPIDLALRDDEGRDESENPAHR